MKNRGLRSWTLLSLVVLLGCPSALCLRGAGSQDLLPKRRIQTSRAGDFDDAALARAADAILRDRAKVREIAKKDGDLRLKAASGRLVYACKPPRLAQGPARPTSPLAPSGASASSAARAMVAHADVGTDTSVYVNDTPFPLDQTFALHTRPGATRILYLDFHGFRVHATEWNDSNDAADDIVMPAFDTDGDPSSFGPAERAAIQEVWRRVAEDYAPFDVDVTTEDPGQANLVYDGPGDDHWGARMVCGGRAVDVLGPGGEGVIGVAFLDSFRTGQSFDSDGNLGSDTPAFCFTDEIVSYEPISYAAEIAYTSSHEYGHTVGLSHDGDKFQEYYPGYAGWAPIMGSGDPNGVVQWSKGEYAYANNKEDDLALIAQNYIPCIPCDHGVDAASAVNLTSGDTAGGVILRASDAAWYKIQAGRGQLTVAGSVASPSPGNLKMKLSLLDASGKTVATSPKDAKMAASLSATLTSGGTYYLVVDGTSYLTPSTGFSDYDSIGRYSLTGTWQPRPPNATPVADATGSRPLSGGSPLMVSFTGLASNDPDGIIVSYLWDFGDGSPTSSLATPLHVYAPGSYTATLTVTDLDGATDTITIPVNASTSHADTKYIVVSAISGSWVSYGRTGTRAACTVTILDGTGRPMRNALVSVSAAGVVSGSFSVKTDRFGRAVLRTGPIPYATKGQATFTVTNVSLRGYKYYPLANASTSTIISR